MQLSRIRHRNTLKKEYLACVGLRTTNAARLQEAVKELVEQGETRETLVQWAISDGISAAAARTLLCRIFVALGLRQRGVGAGRKAPAEALDLLVYARNRYGERHLRLLRAALRAGRTETEKSFADQRAGQRGHDRLNYSPQLEGGDSNNSPQLGIKVPPLRTASNGAHRPRELSNQTTRNLNRVHQP